MNENDPDNADHRVSAVQKGIIEYSHTFNFH
jgi:hypothetical protein